MQTRFTWMTVVTAITLWGACDSPETAADEVQRESDLAAIDELHERDRKASLRGDASALLALWSDDPAALPPRGPVLRGRDSLMVMLNRHAEARQVWETIEYEQDFIEVEVLGEYAWDWGIYRGKSRNRETGKEVSSSGKLFRILKKSPDGSWRVHRSIWNVEPRATSR